jgi:hypothetical protein
MLRSLEIELEIQVREAVGVKGHIRDVGLPNKYVGGKDPSKSRPSTRRSPNIGLGRLNPRTRSPAARRQGWP